MLVHDSCVDGHCVVWVLQIKLVGKVVLGRQRLGEISVDVDSLRLRHGDGVGVKSEICLQSVYKTKN